MRLNINHAGRIAILFFCALLLVRVQAQDSGVPTTKPVAPLKDGNHVTPPRATYMPDPEYSEEARQAKLQGTCVLSLVVDTDGKPRDIAVVRKLGKGLDENAVETVRTWKFEPARKDGLPVAIQIQIKVSFSVGGKLPREQLKQMSKANAETRARMQALVYRVSDDGALRTCRTLTADGKPHAGSTITIVELSFEGDLKMPATEQARVISRLISQRRYSGSREEAISQVLESIRSTWEDHGYLKAEVHDEAKTLSVSPTDERLAITAHVDEGPQYRLESIGFKNNMAFTNKDALRSLFSITDGEPYNRSLITEGLEKIRSAYAGEGYINFTASPGTSINDASHTVSVTVAFEEGKMFYVSRVDIMGLDEPEFRKVRKELLVTPGQPYNERLVGVFLRNHRKLLLPNDTSTEPRFTLQRNEGDSTVAITYDFRRCHVE
jgi:TonB family protein